MKQKSLRCKTQQNGWAADELQMKESLPCMEELKTFPGMQHKKAGKEHESQLERHGEQI